MAFDLKSFIKKAALALTPKSVERFYVHNYLKRFGMENGLFEVVYSQQGEDLILRQIFNGRRNGFYVDIGAFHPFKYSNTCWLYQKGWRGINVEPNPDLYQLFLEHRPHDINLNLAVGDDGEKLTYYKFDHPALNSFDTVHIENWSSRPGYNVIERIEIETMGLERMLSTYLPKELEIDVLTVDTEGWDLQVLKSNNWERYRPEIVAVEDSLVMNHLSKPGPIVNYLQHVGYELFNITGITLFFRDGRPRK